MKFLGCYAGIILMLSLVWCVMPVQAVAADLSLTQTGRTTFQLMGNGLSVVHGLELTITYDAASLTAPTVSAGQVLAGALSMPNTMNAGVIRFNTISTSGFKDAGDVMTITFATRIGSGGLTSATVKAFDAASKALQLSAPINNSPELSKMEDAQPPVAAVESNTITPPPATTNPPVTATPQTPRTSSVVLVDTAPPALPSTPVAPVATASEQVTQQPAQASVDQAPPPKDAPEPEAVKPAQEIVKSSIEADKTGDDKQLQMQSFTSVAERLRVYNGDKSAAILEALFRKPVTDPIVQKPLVAISDGVTPVTIIMTLPKSAIAPNFAVTGARLKSARRASETSWRLELLPQAKVWQAMLTVMLENRIIEYPLTITPPLPKGLTADEKGFNRFMKEQLTAEKTVAHDLNNDGKRDYIDEYIFVANMVAAKLRQEKPKK